MASDLIVEEARDTWSFKSDYFFVALAYLFSVYNLCNFDTDLSKNGGAAFLVAYLVSLVFVVIPLVLMELAVGQYTGRSPVQAMGRMCPLFKGVGVSLALLSLIVASFFGIRIGYHGIYIVELFRSLVPDSPHELPWQRCDPAWASIYCENFLDELRTTNSPGQEPPYSLAQLASTTFQPNETTTHMFSTTSENTTFLAQSSFYTDDIPETTLSHIGAIRDFYKKRVQNLSPNIEMPGNLVWQPIAASGAVWFLVFLAVFLGIRWLGKICYFTVVIPLILLAAVLVRTLTLPGTAGVFAKNFDTNWDMLLEPETWQLAFSRSLRACGLCFGSFITLGSHSRSRSNNMVRDAYLFVLLHGIFIAVQLLVTTAMNEYVKKISPADDEALDRMEFDRVLGSLLFCMSEIKHASLWCGILLFMAGLFMLNTMYVLTYNVLACLEDALLGHVGSRIGPRIGLALLTCLAGFVLGLGYTVQSGGHALELMRMYFELLPYWVVLFFEILAVAWFYCGHVLAVDLRHMLRRTCAWCLAFFNLYLAYLLPAVPLYILVVKLMGYSAAESHRDFDWVVPVAWLLAVLPVLPIPLGMIWVAVKACVHGPGITYYEKLKHTVISPMRYEVRKSSSNDDTLDHHHHHHHHGQDSPRYASGGGGASPGYVLLPQHAPLAEPEAFEYSQQQQQRDLKVSNI